MDALNPNERNMLIWKGAAVATLLCACGCLGGLALFSGIFGSIFGTFATMEKTYYPDCEMLGTDTCQACCQSHGHNGHAVGQVLNEQGKECGCL